MQLWASSQHRCLVQQPFQSQSCLSRCAPSNVCVYQMAPGVAVMQALVYICDRHMPCVLRTLYTHGCMRGPPLCVHQRTSASTAFPWHTSVQGQAHGGVAAILQCQLPHTPNLHLHMPTLLDTAPLNSGASLEALSSLPLLPVPQIARHLTTRSRTLLVALEYNEKFSASVGLQAALQADPHLTRCAWRSLCSGHAEQRRAGLLAGLWVAITLACIALCLCGSKPAFRHLAARPSLTMTT